MALRLPLALSRLRNGVLARRLLRHIRHPRVPPGLNLGRIEVLVVVIDPARAEGQLVAQVLEVPVAVLVARDEGARFGVAHVLHLVAGFLEVGQWVAEWWVGTGMEGGKEEEREGDVPWARCARGWLACGGAWTWLLLVVVVFGRSWEMYDEVGDGMNEGGYRIGGVGAPVLAFNASFVLSMKKSVTKRQPPTMRFYTAWRTLFRRCPWIK